MKDCEEYNKLKEQIELETQKFLETNFALEKRNPKLEELNQKLEISDIHTIDELASEFTTNDLSCLSNMKVDLETEVESHENTKFELANVKSKLDLATRLSNGQIEQIQKLEQHVSEKAIIINVKDSEISTLKNQVLELKSHNTLKDNRPLSDNYAFRMSENSFEKQSNKTFPRNARDQESSPPRMSNFTSIPTSKRPPERPIRYESTFTEPDTEKNNNYATSDCTTETVIHSIAQCDECPKMLISGSERFYCLNVPEFDLCEEHFKERIQQNTWIKNKPFLQFQDSYQPWNYLKLESLRKEFFLLLKQIHCGRIKVHHNGGFDN